MFHRFWRADPARARTVGGTGLGLAIAMEDANLHGGWLTAWGRPGLGAQFRLTLPRRRGMVLRTSPLPLVPRDLVPAAGPGPAEPDSTASRPSTLADMPSRRPGSPGRHAEGRPVRRRPPTRRRCRDEPRSPRPLPAGRCWSCCPGWLTGCVQVPTAGPIERVEGQQTGVPELHQRRGGPAGARRRAAPDRPGLPAGDLELPAELLHRQAVPDREAARRPGSPEAGVHDLHAASPKADGDAGHLERPAGRAAGRGPHLHRRGPDADAWTSAWSRRTGSGGSATHRRV